MNVKKELEKVGCIYEGHFVGVSGKHLAGYCNIDPLLPHVNLVSRMIKLLVADFKNSGVEVVVSPAVGAIPFSHWGAYHLSKMLKKDIKGVWADKVKNSEKKAFAFERQGFLEAVKEKKVLILEDMINQMFSIKAIIETVEKAGGKIVGVGCVAANRGVSAKAMGVKKFVNLCNIQYDVWTPEDCVNEGLCSKNVPIVEDIGHGDEFKKEHPKYKGGYMKLLG
jgi:orotate phosphoribosyltransferase